MKDDWRLKVDLHEHGFAHRLHERLAARDLEHDLESSFADRVVVSLEGAELFCYTGTRDQAERVQTLIAELAKKNDWKVDLELTHWHPTAEEWEDPNAPLPATPTQTGEELQDRYEEEREESAEQGYPDFEVRVVCSDRDDAEQLSKRLEDEGIPNIHRYSYVLIGATDEASGQALAEQVAGELPAGTQVTVERNERAVYDARPASPFAFLGGLAG